MASRTAAVRFVLPAWSVLLVTAGVVGAVIVDPDAQLPGTRLTDPPLVAGPVTSTTTVPSSTAASSVPAPQTTGEPGASASPPAPGAYRYVESTTGSDGKVKESNRTTTATRVGQDGEDVVERVTVPFATGSGEVTAVATIAWGPKGVTTRDWVVRLYGGSFTCDWQPDVTQYPAQLVVGASWASNSACTGKVQGGQLDGTDATMRHTSTRKVTGTKVDPAPSGPVPTWTVTAVSDLELSASGIGGVTHTDATEQYAPALGVVTSSQATVAVDSFGSKKTSRTVTTLVGQP